MPQLSLYLDDATHREVEVRAKLGNMSASRFVTSILKMYFTRGWPTGYHNIFGSIDDDTFVIQGDTGWVADAPRERL